MGPGCEGLVLPSLPGRPPAPEPPSPRSCNLNKASFHVFIELLPLRHFPGTIRPFEGLGQFGSQAGVGVENGPRPRPEAELVPSYPYTSPGAGWGGAGAWGSREAMLPGSCVFCKMGRTVPASPTTGCCSLDLKGMELRLTHLCGTALGLGW